LALLEQNYAPALTAFEAFAAARPNANTGHFARGKALLALGQTETALAAFQRGLELTYKQRDVAQTLDDLARLRQRAPAVDTAAVEALLLTWHPPQAPA
jgi:tetratricopeptide (TPR) repeat protein